MKAGLREIQKGQRQGILSLVKVAGLSVEQISASDIGFMLAPRLNAAGRLESALDALNLLTSHDLMEAGQLAQKLNNQNRERQEVTAQMIEHAQQQENMLDADGLLLAAFNREYNPGVVGLAASRLTELFYRPAIVGHRNDTVTRASCRSIPEFHITNALDECSDILLKHGGHAAAAGFTVQNDHLSDFRFHLHAC